MRNGALGPASSSARAEVPLPGGQIVEFREQHAKQVVGLSIVRVCPQSRARHLLGIRTAPVREEKLSQIVVGPICPRIDADDGLQRARGFADLAALPLDNRTQLERVDVCGCALEPFLGGGFSGAQVAAREGLAAASNDRVSRIGTGHSGTMVPASMRLV